MCSESHYCTLVEYIICHAAFTGCHLAERLRCSWKPLSASNDIIKIGARGVAGGSATATAAFLARPARAAGGTGAAALRTPLRSGSRARAGTEGAAVPGTPRGPGSHRGGGTLQSAPAPCSAHPPEGSDLRTARPTAGCPSTVTSHGAGTLRRARGVRLGLGWGHGSWEAPLEALLPGAAPARPG